MNERGTWYVSRRSAAPDRAPAAVPTEELGNSIPGGRAAQATALDGYEAAAVAIQEQLGDGRLSALRDTSGTPLGGRSVRKQPLSRSC
jgi:hypothetical protein